MPGPPLPRLRPAEITPEMREADIWAEEVIAEQLPRTRQLAQQWGATLAALTAVFGAGTVIDADDAVRALHPEGWAILYGVLAAAAVISAAVAMLLAARAAQGWLTTIPPGAPERLTLRRKLADDAQSQLRWSRRAAAVALVLLISSFGVRWYAPQQTAAPAGRGSAERVASSV